MTCSLLLFTGRNYSCQDCQLFLFWPELGGNLQGEFPQNIIEICDMLTAWNMAGNGPPVLKAADIGSQLLLKGWRDNLAVILPQLAKITEITKQSS